MLKRILYGSGALSVLTAGYLLGSVSLGGAFAQTAPPATPTSQAQTAPGAGESGETNDAGGANEQAESAALASQAKISTNQADATALAQFPGGTVGKTELDNENGTIVYSVQVTDSSGKKQEVKVDATSGNVLPAQAGESQTGEAHD